MYKFIHIAFDSIFLDYTIEQFETIIPNRSEYIVDIPYERYDVKHVRSLEKICSKVLNEQKEKDSILKKLTKDSIVILHCLNPNMIDIVNKAECDITFVWIAWGGEVNTLPLLSKNLYQPLTFKIINQLYSSSFKNRLYNKYPQINHLLYKLKNGKTHPVIEKINAIRRINYAGTFIKQDFDLFSSTYRFNLNWLWYCYYNIDDTMKSNSPVQNSTKENILVGNSSDPRNNHIDILQKLEAFDLKNKKIICPLSYGTTDKEYVNKIKHYGASSLDNHFLPLVDFLPLKEYNAILNECGIVIMNHNVQQAVGNIISALWNGAKLFLNNSNPIYAYLKALGIIVYSIQNDLKKENPEALINLSDIQIAHNQSVLYGELSRESVYKKTAEMINALQKNI